MGEIQLLLERGEDPFKATPSAGHQYLPGSFPRSLQLAERFLPQGPWF